MKYKKSTIISLSLLGGFSVVCLTAAACFYFAPEQSPKIIKKEISNDVIRQGLEKRLLDNMQQSMLEFNKKINLAFNDEFFAPFDSYFSEMEQKFSDALAKNRQDMYRLNSKAVRSSSFMIENTDDEFKVSALMQNVTKDMLDITVHKGFLEVAAKQKVEDDKKDENKQAYSSFKKVIKLPKNVDGSKAETSFKDNVLVITFPKIELEEEKPLKLDIK